MNTMMHVHMVVWVAALLVIHVSSSKVPGGRRQCEEQMRTLRETQELLHGEIATMKNSLNKLTSFVASTIPEDCSVARTRGSWTTVTQVRPPGLEPREVRCDQQSAGGGWTVILARYPAHEDHHHRHDFNRSWNQYKQGFGDINGEFWIGNDVLHSLTRDVPNQLRVTLADWSGDSAVSTWDYFRIGSESDQYRLSVGKYHKNSTGGDALSHHNNHAFSTYDHDHDIDDLDHCAQRYGGGWWYFRCFESHPTGKALPPNEVSRHAIVWRPWKATNGLKNVTMMIRPVAFLE